STSLQERIASMSSSSAATGSRAIASCVAELAASDALTDVSNDDLQRLLAAALRLYSAKVEEYGDFPIAPQGSVTATDAMIGSTGLLAAANVAVFELGCWQR